MKTHILLLTHRRMNKLLWIVILPLLTYFPFHANGSDWAKGSHSGSIPTPQAVYDCCGAPAGGPHAPNCPNRRDSSSSNSQDDWEREQQRQAREEYAWEQNQKGEEAWNRGDYQKALECYQTAMKYSRNPLYRKNYEKAKQKLREIRELEIRAKSAAQKEELRWKEKQERLNKMLDEVKTIFSQTSGRNWQVDRSTLSSIHSLSVATLPPGIGLYPFSNTNQAPISEQEWREFYYNQQQILELGERPQLLPDKKALLDQLTTRQTRLWFQTTQNPSLTQSIRNQLAIQLPVRQPSQGIYSLQLPSSSENTPLSTHHPVHQLLNTVTFPISDQLLSMGMESTVKNLYGEQAVEKVSTILGLGKIALATREDPAKGIAESVDFIIGLLPTKIASRANWAVQGGRIYTTVVAQAINDFMSKTEQALGGSWDPQIFWEDFRKEQNLFRQTQMEWLGLGE